MFFSQDNVTSILLREKEYNIQSIPFFGTEQEWEDYSLYIPKDGEFIIYIPDKNKGESRYRIKIGNGEKTVKQLDFVYIDSSDEEKELIRLVQSNAQTINQLKEKMEEFEQNLINNEQVANAINEALDNAKKYTDQKIVNISFPVNSVNGKTGEVILSAEDIGAAPSGNYITKDDLADVIDSAPEALDTLNELAQALGEDPNFATTIATNIGKKVDKVDGKGLSTNDYTTDEKNKLKGIEEGANKTVVDDSLSSTSTNPVQNKIINDAIGSLNTLVGDTKVSEQITTVVDEKISQHNSRAWSHPYITANALKIQDVPHLINEKIQRCSTMIYGNGKYITIIEDYFISVSSDGINWSTTELPVKGAYECGTYGNGKYVFYSANNELSEGIVLYSEDAISWEYSIVKLEILNENSGEIIILPGTGFNNITFGNDLFVLSGQAPSNFCSSDCINWDCGAETTEELIDKFIIYENNHLNFGCMCYGDGKFVGFSDRLVNGKIPFMTSTNGLDWTVDAIDTMSLEQETIENFQPPITSIAHKSGMFIAIAPSKITLQSSDGVNWIVRNNLPYLGFWTKLIYADDKFIAAAEASELGKPIMAYSDDGLNWHHIEDVRSVTGAPFVSLVAGEQIVALTLNGELAFSQDGIDWDYAVKSVVTLDEEDKTSDLKEVLDIGDPIYAAEESVDTSVETINADTLGGYSSSDFRHSDWMPTAADVGARANDWLPTIAEIGAAPAGYGYGGKITTKIYNINGTEADFNAMLENVFASMSDETAMQVQFLDASTGYSYIYTATLYKSYSDYGWLKGTDYGGRNLQKIKRGGTWQPWEWVNPPMIPGKEYRTTERHNGKPVWKCLTKITGLPNSAYGMYNLAATYCEHMVGKHISYERTDGADFLEYIEAGEIYFGNYGTPYIVFNKTQADLSNMTAYVTLRYTKTTD